MYKGFNLKLTELMSSNSNFDDNKAQVKKTVIDYLGENNNIFANELSNEWFPAIKADVFISHSHKDTEIAKSLASWIEQNFEITCFIDSTVWGNFNDIARDLNNRFSKGHQELNYEKVLCTSNHVNALLSTALTKMIDTCECVIFLNTDNSSTTAGFDTEDGTYSSWLSHEIYTSKIIRKTRPTRMDAIHETVYDSLTASVENYTVTYDLDLSHLIGISKNDLNKWLDKKNIELNSLDVLYSL